MNTEDSFEQKLRRQPYREAPPRWREEILTGARLAATESSAARRPTSGLSFFAACRRNLTNWLWPHPTAWAGLAAIWLLILILNVTTRDSARPQLAGQSAPPSPELQELLREQEQMLADLIGPVEKSGTSEPKRRLPGPRSQRPVELLNI